MEQYISKSALVAEIEKLKAEALQKKSQCKRSGLEKIMHQIGAYNKVLSFLDTLEVKEANEALRTEYEKGRADVIAKTLEWINVFNDNNYIMQYSDSCEHPINEIIEWYKNYINKE